MKMISKDRLSKKAIKNLSDKERAFRSFAIREHVINGETGRGIKKPNLPTFDHEKLINRLEVIAAEIQAGNNSHIMKQEGHNIIDKLSGRKLLTRDQTKKLISMLN